MVGSIGVNGKWKDSHEISNRKGKVNGLVVANSLAKLGNVVLNVVHALHE